MSFITAIIGLWLLGVFFSAINPKEEKKDGPTILGTAGKAVGKGLIRTFLK